MKAAVLIPVYKSVMDKPELISFTQVCKVLKNYPIILVCPIGLDLKVYFDIYPKLLVEYFDKYYFKDLEGYNRLMLSRNFYKRFVKYNYILIHQLDAFVFSDELEYWCAQKYDYIGAPWIEMNIYNWFFIKPYPKLLRYIHRALGKGKYLCKVGNGGFSLRKVDSCLANINLFKNTASNWQANEDSFFSHYVKTFNPFFKIASFKTAIKFSFDIHPKKAFELNNFQLPFGCHAWFKEDPLYKENLIFWNNFINIS